MYLDKGREHDLEQLYKERKTASASQREKIDYVIDKIMREAGAMSSDRECLIKAIRAGDKRTIRYYQHKLDIKTKDMYGGKYDRY